MSYALYLAITALRQGVRHNESILGDMETVRETLFNMPELAFDPDGMMEVLRQFHTDTTTPGPESA